MKKILLLLLFTASTACASSNQWSKGPLNQPFELKSKLLKNRFSAWMNILEKQTGIPIHLDRAKLSENEIDVEEIVFRTGFNEDTPLEFILDTVDQLVDPNEVIVVRIKNDSVTITTK